MRSNEDEATETFASDGVTAMGGALRNFYTKNIPRPYLHIKTLIVIDIVVMILLCEEINFTFQIPNNVTV